MTAAALKSADQALSRSSIPTAAATTKTSRKPWRKRSPVEVFVDQIERLREDVQEKEEELKLARKQLQRLEEARKVLESA